MTNFFTILASLLLACSMCHANLSMSSLTPDANPPMFVPSSAPTTDCGSINDDMVDCIPFLFGDESKPDEACCSGFESVVTINAGCICKIMGSNDLPFTLDHTKAMMLPSACGVTSPFSECDISISPTQSPDDAPGPYDPESPVPSQGPEGPLESPSPSPPVPSPEAGPSESPASSSPVPARSPSPKRSLASPAAHPISIPVVVLIVSVFFVYFY